MAPAAKPIAATGATRRKRTTERKNVKVKELNINLASRQMLNLEEGYAKGMASGSKHGAPRGSGIFEKRSSANDPYSLRRRLLRTVLKRIALIAFLCLPPAAMTHLVGHHWQSISTNQFIQTSDR
jgi:hypothetical protein